MRVQCRSEDWKHEGGKAALGVYSRMMQFSLAPGGRSAWWLSQLLVSCVGLLKHQGTRRALGGRGKNSVSVGQCAGSGKEPSSTSSILTRSYQKAADPGRVFVFFLHCNRIPCIAESSGKKARLEDKGQGFRVQGPFRKGQALLC